MAELADAPDLGSGVRKGVEVQVLSGAPSGILATVAKFEADRMSNRVRSGLARARAQGKTLGRPRAILDRDKLAKMRADGMSLREIAEATEKSTMTIQRILKARRRS